MKREKLQSLIRDEELGDNMGEDAVCDYPPLARTAVCL